MKDSSENRRGAVCWTDDDKSAQRDINGGFAIRCLGPDGEIFEDSPPEKIIKQMAAEDGVDFQTEETELRRIHSKMKKDQKEMFKYGMYVDDEHLAVKTKFK